MFIIVIVSYFEQNTSRIFKWEEFRMGLCKNPSKLLTCHQNQAISAGLEFSMDTEIGNRDQKMPITKRKSNLELS